MDEKVLIVFEGKDVTAMIIMIFILISSSLGYSGELYG